MVADGLINTTAEKVNEYSAKNSFKCEPDKPGTLLMSFKLTIGRVSILDTEAYHNEAIISIYPYINTDNIMRNYLFKALPLISKYGISKKAIKGNTLNSDSLKALFVPLPPLAEQERIVEKLDVFTELEKELRMEADLRHQQLEHYRDSLITGGE